MWWIFTFQVHPCHQTLAKAAGWAVLPPDLVYYAVVPPSTQVIMLPCGTQKRKINQLFTFTAATNTPGGKTN